MGAVDLIAKSSGDLAVARVSPNIDIENLRYRYSDQGPWVCDKASRPAAMETLPDLSTRNLDAPPTSRLMRFDADADAVFF